MKKVGIIVLIIILMMIVTALCNILIFAIHHNNWNWFMSFGSSENLRKEEYIRKEQKIAIDDTKKINLEFKSSHLNLFFTEGNEIRVVQYAYKDLPEEELFQIDKTSSNIRIGENMKPRFHLFYIRIYGTNSI